MDSNSYSAYDVRYFTLGAATLAIFVVLVIVVIWKLFEDDL